MRKEKKKGRKKRNERKTKEMREKKLVRGKGRKKGKGESRSCTLRFPVFRRSEVDKSISRELKLVYSTR